MATHARQDLFYADCQVPYRRADTAALLPEQKKHGLCDLPLRPGIATPVARMGRPENVAMPVLDGRKVMAAGEKLSLEEQGWVHIRHASSMDSATTIGGSTSSQFYDQEAVLNDYFPEVEAIIRSNVKGASHPDAKVLIFDHAIRSGGQKLAQIEQVNPYAGIVHSDATIRSGHTRAKDQIMGTNETEVKYGKLPACWGDVRPTQEWRRKLFRADTTDHGIATGDTADSYVGGAHLIVNVWRPITGPVRQWPLALLDARTLPQGDVHPTMMNLYDNSPGGKAGAPEKMQDESNLKVHDEYGNKIRLREGEIITPLHSKEHRWLVFPQMTPEEVLLLKVFDSRVDGRARFGCHSAVYDPRGEKGAERESIEVRCLVILPPEPEHSKL